MSGLANRIKELSVAHHSHAHRLEEFQPLGILSNVVLLRLTQILKRTHCGSFIEFDEDVAQIKYDILVIHHR